MKAAIYTRVSTIDKGQSLEQQEIPLINFCKENKWNYEVFKEHASGSKESRPKLDQMLQGIRNKDFQAVVIFRLDRLGRSLKHLLQLVEEFKNRKIKFICLNPNIDTTTSQGMFFLQIMGAAAEFERQLIRERIQDKINYYQEQIKEKGFAINPETGKKIRLGRPIGSKDKGERRKSGYIDRWLKNRTKKYTP